MRPSHPNPNPRNHGHRSHNFDYNDHDQSTQDDEESRYNSRYNNTNRNRFYCNTSPDFPLRFHWLNLEEHAYKVQQHASRFMAKTFHATLSVSTHPGQQIAAVTNFYTNVANHIAAFGMAIDPCAELSSSTDDYFVSSQEAQYLGIKVMDLERHKYLTVIRLKIVPNIKCSQLQITMNQLFVSNHQDGFNMIRMRMEMHIPRIWKPHTPSAYVEQTGARPTFQLKSNLYTFQSDLNLYYQNEVSYNCTYFEMEKTNVFFGPIENDTRNMKAPLDIRNALPRDITAEVTAVYRIGHIADTICNHSSVVKGVGLDAFYGEATQPQIKYTEAP